MSMSDEDAAHKHSIFIKKLLCPPLIKTEDLFRGEKNVGECLACSLACSLIIWLLKEEAMKIVLFSVVNLIA